MGGHELLLADGDQQPGATPAQIEFARNWRDTPKVVFSSAMEKVDRNTRLVTGDAVAEITRLTGRLGAHLAPDQCLEALIRKRARCPAPQPSNQPAPGRELVSTTSGEARAR